MPQYRDFRHGRVHVAVQGMLVLTGQNTLKNNVPIVTLVNHIISIKIQVVVDNKLVIGIQTTWYIIIPSD